MTPTPKEKAKELVDKYLDANHTIEDWKIDINIDFELAKQCALIAVDELINEAVYEKQYNYWQEVKQEIERL